jgi:hypothetical protein
VGGKRGEERNEARMDGVEPMRMQTELCDEWEGRREGGTVEIEVWVKWQALV